MKKQTFSVDNSVTSAVPGAKKIFSSLLFRETAIFILTFLFFSFWAFKGIDPHHDGVMLIPAIRVAQGAVVFRDVFCQYGLLVPLLQGMAVALFGAELLVIRILTVLFYAGCAVLLDLLWRRFIPSRISFLIPLLFNLLSPCTMATFHSWNSVYALFFMLLYGFFIIRYLEKEKPLFRNCFLAGIAAALTWLCRMPCGAVTLLAAQLVLLGANWFTGKKWQQIVKETVLFWGGWLVIMLAGAGYILFSGAWEDFINQSFRYVVEFAHDRGSKGSWLYFCDSMFPFYQDGLWYFNSLFAFLPVISLGMLYFALRRGIIGGAAVMKENLPFIALLILGLGSWHQYYPVPCIRHLFWGGIPMLGVCILLISRSFAKKGLWWKILSAALILLVVMALVCRFVGMTVRGGFTGWQSSDIPGIRHIRLNPSERGLIRLCTPAGDIPETILRRGIMVLGEDSLFLALPGMCDFRHTCFYRLKSRFYADYETQQINYIFQHYPIVLSDRQVKLPGYFPVAYCKYMGKNFTVYLPVR